MAPSAQEMPSAPASLCTRTNIIRHTKNEEISRMLSQPSITRYLSYADNNDAVKAREQSHTGIIDFQRCKTAIQKLQQKKLEKNSLSNSWKSKKKRMTKTDLTKEREEEGISAVFHFLFFPTTLKLKSPHT